MPFIPLKNRESIADGNQPETVGDQCYIVYCGLIDAWKKEPRWTTAHNLFKETFDVTDEQAAKTLAYLVFFNLHVIPYELEKKDQNGDI